MQNRVCRLLLDGPPFLFALGLIGLKSTPPWKQLVVMTLLAASPLLLVLVRRGTLRRWWWDATSAAKAGKIPY